ncbi:MAG: hypothetical protein U0528_18415 [Anaerolineae bacterium]
MAIIWNASISGCIVLCLGIEFGLTLVFAPERGLLAGMLRRRRQKWEFAAQLLVVHLLNHEDTPEVQVETAIRNLPEHLNWQQTFADQVTSGQIGAVGCSASAITSPSPIRDAPSPAASWHDKLIPTPYGYTSVPLSHEVNEVRVRLIP